SRVRRTRRRGRAALEADRRLMRVPRAGTLVVATTLVLGALVFPAPAQAALPLPGLPNPFDLGLPDAGDLIGKVFEFFFKTFFGIETKVTQQAVEWLLAAPVYTDTGAYGDLNQLRGNIEVAAWA